MQPSWRAAGLATLHQGACGWQGLVQIERLGPTTRTRAAWRAQRFTPGGRHGERDRRLLCGLWPPLRGRSQPAHALSKASISGGKGGGAFAAAHSRCVCMQEHETPAGAESRRASGAIRPGSRRRLQARAGVGLLEQLSGGASQASSRKPPALKRNSSAVVVGLCQCKNNKHCLRWHACVRVGHVRATCMESWRHSERRLQCKRVDRATACC